MSTELISTTLIDDPDPDGTDVYGMIPLLAEVPEDEDENEDEDDTSGEDEELRPLIEPSSLEIEMPEDEELTDDDEALDLLSEPGYAHLTPGEAQALVTYMRPLTDDEAAIADDPDLGDLRWVDNPAHTDDVLKAGEGDRGLDQLFNDASYGETMTPEEILDRRDSDKIPTRMTARRIHARAKTSYDPRRDFPKAAVVTGLGKKLVVEHANWLADQDKSSGIVVRPRSYYEDVARLWTKHQLDSAKIPATSSGNWSPSPRRFASAAQHVLRRTENARSRFSTALGVEVDMGGWNPFHAVTHAVSSAVRSAERVAKKGTKLAYRGVKFGVTKPFEYTYKGVKYVGSMAQKVALAPIKALIRRFSGKMVNRRAALLAKQRGLASPGPAEKTEALTWAKDFTRKSSSKYGGTIASLMGSDARDPRVRDVDISFGDNVGSALGTLWAIISFGPLALAQLLNAIFGRASKSGQAPPPDPGSDAALAEAAAEADAAANPPDADTPPAADYPDTGAPPAADYPDTGYPDAGQPSDYDTSGYSRPTVSVEQLQNMRPQTRKRAQALVRMGKLHLA